METKKEEIKPHIQIVHFVGGLKRTIPGVVRVWENEWTHIIDIGGTEWIINKNLVLFVEKVKND